jgi:hypothetical protein
MGSLKTRLASGFSLRHLAVSGLFLLCSYSVLGIRRLFAFVMQRKRVTHITRSTM